MELTRTCPKCGRSQMVRSSRRNEAVTCKFCGAPIPAKRPRDGRPSGNKL